MKSSFKIFIKLSAFILLFTFSGVELHQHVLHFEIEAVTLTPVSSGSSIYISECNCDEESELLLVSTQYSQIIENIAENNFEYPISKLLAGSKYIWQPPKIS